MLKIKSFTFNPYQENTYLIFDDSKEAIIIDPGNYEAYENESISKFIDENKLGEKYDFLIVDFHAEITSEKMAIGHFFDGNSTCVVGTHTHIPTADTRILDKLSLIHI